MAEFIRMCKTFLNFSVVLRNKKTCGFLVTSITNSLSDSCGNRSKYEKDIINA